MRALIVISLLVTLPEASPSWGFAPTHPHLGQCSVTKVKAIGSRLEGDPSSGSTISYANGLRQVSYDEVPGIERSRRGDPVRLCVSGLPKNCPKGDFRGIVYRATNLRTEAKWEEADSEHECGGL